MVGAMSDSLPRMKTGLACGSGGHGQIANPDIDANDIREVCGGWVREIDGQGDEQIEPLLWPVIPQFGIPNGGSLPNERNVLVVPLIGNTDPSVQGPNTDLALTLKGVIPLIGVLHGRGTVVRWLVQPFKAFLRDLLAAMLSILLALRPHSLVGSGNLSLDATS